MKFIAVVLVALLLVAQAHTVKSPAQEVIDTIEGILVGAFGEIGREAKVCIQDGENIFKYVAAAIGNFKKGTTASIIEGLFYIGKALEEIPAEVENCKDIPELVKEFEKIAAEFKDPKSLAIHIGKEILFNGKSIYNDVVNSIHHFEAGDYSGAGESIGDIVKILFIDEEINGRLEVTQFVEGFFRGSLRDESADVNACIDDGNEIIDVLERIIADFESGILDNMEKIFLDFIDLLTEIPKSVLQCENVPKDIEKLEKWALEMRDLHIMEKRVFNAFLTYPQRIKENSKGLIDDYKRRLYRNSGNYLGDTLYVFFELVKPELERQGGVISELIKN